MPKFVVRIREVHLSYREVEAETANAAMAAIVNGDEDGTEILCEYHDTLDHDRWDVTDGQGNILMDGQDFCWPESSQS